MKLVSWQATDSQAIFGTPETPSGVKIVAIGQKEDASGYCGLCFEDTVPSQCAEMQIVPENTYYFVYQPTQGYWLTSALVRFACNDQRSQELQTSKVTVDDLVFDANEISQSRAARTWLGMEDSEQAPWVLANNTAVMLTRPQIKAFMVAAGQNQLALWAKYSCAFQ